MNRRIPKGKKWVLIKEKLWVEVDENIPNEEAVKSYLSKLDSFVESKVKNPKGAGRPKKDSKPDILEESE